MKAQDVNFRSRVPRIISASRRIVFGDQASANMQEMTLMQAGRGKIDFCI